MTYGENLKSGALLPSASVLKYGSVLSAIAALLVFFTSLDNQFVALDDYEYIINNRNIDVLDWSTVCWAFTSHYNGNWHPLTMLSYAFDRHLWGLDPTGYHLVNILIHSLVVFVVCHLFSELLQLSRAQSPDNSGKSIGVVIGSIIGALFFGLHPLRVESVVWVSERKDVLCLLFMTAATWCYLRYARQVRIGELIPFWRIGSYWAALVLAALATLSKPTAVSMPFILCILDWYPLGRWRKLDEFMRSCTDKIPFLLLSLILSIQTMLAQQVAMKPFDEIDLMSRLLVACKALFFYPAKTLWPSDLTAFYVHPGNVASVAPGEYLVYAVLAAVLVLSAVATVRRRKFWTALVCFYLVTLAPMLGIVQVGGQWVADRYSYLPALAFSLLLGGGIAWMLEMFHSKRTAGYSFVCLTLVIFQLLIYTFITLCQIPVWNTTETLATRIIDLQPHRTGAVYYARAVYRNYAGNYQNALEDIGEAMKIALRQNRREVFANIAFEHALILKNMRRMAEALAIAEWGMQTSLESPSTDALALYEELKRFGVTSHSVQ
ncbi:MAG: hypothetical protein A2X82_06325 [Geobacteraceae bacterium GWC2_55_20]|nr:MAG: hypothetical protein A2X82_06325 [Geobacteraceae bacterium GWC2_55_20]OGU26020.1 MAG: hypothetical protein A2X85_12035 [Geobacteraceae bacterium GWF2_54_21]HBA71926.1 hypothetical protein [Geobacter sp.]HCE69680.1 hypothetical protein [Geobacter sp.]